MARLKIEREMDPSGVVVLKISGGLDAHTYEDLERTLAQVFDQKLYRIIVDVGELLFISSAGAGILINAVDQARKNDGDVVFLNPTSRFRDLFDLLGISPVCTYCTSREEAIEKFK